MLDEIWMACGIDEVLSANEAAALHRQSLRARLGESQNWRCAYCQHLMADDPHAVDGITLDHVVPRRLAGRASYANSVAACRACNQWRGSMDAHIFSAIVASGGKPGSLPPVHVIAAAAGLDVGHVRRRTMYFVNEGPFRRARRVAP